MDKQENEQRKFPGCKLWAKKIATYMATSISFGY
jgi:hypothetical protein